MDEALKSLNDFRAWLQGTNNREALERYRLLMEWAKTDDAIFGVLMYIVQALRPIIDHPVNLERVTKYREGLGR